MGLRIQNNIEAFNTHRQLQVSSAAASASMEKLSSGYRINRAADDAAGLAISEQMRGQIGGLDQAQRNAQDGISLVQTGEGALGEVHAMLQRLRDLKVQYESGTLNSDDKAAIDKEASALASEISDIRGNTDFNGIKLLDGTGGTPAGTVTLLVGANATDTVDANVADINAGAGMTAVATLTGASLSTVSLANVDDAIKEVSTVRAGFGAVQNRLDHRLNSLATYQENLTASESRIRDVDMASEMTNYTKENILQQAGTSMLAQANQAPQLVLSLLRQ